ncbi:hypothetical protein DS885_01615 [Psychromonas sp. B3M02]|nr:hypothetical protein DS885_01615 [Psychromonas sp. B3M02]
MSLIGIIPPNTSVRHKMKDSENFSVRVNFRPQQSVAVPAETSLHWGRIITCLLLVVLVIALIIGLSQPFLIQQKPTIENTNDASALNSTNTSQPNQDIAKPDTKPLNAPLALNTEISSNQQAINVNKTSVVAVAENKPQLNIAPKQEQIIDTNDVALASVTENLQDQNIDAKQLQTTIAEDPTVISEDEDQASIALESTQQAVIDINNIDQIQAESIPETEAVNLATNNINQFSEETSKGDDAFTDIDAHVSNTNIEDTSTADLDAVEEPQQEKVVERKPTIIVDNETEINEQHLLAQHITLPPSTLLIQGTVQRLSDHINRFQIAPMVEDHEPLGTINDIEFEDGTLTIYAFSEVYDLKDTVLYYVWSLNGRDVATVPIKIGADRWRSHSTKFIEPSMKGQWSVKLQNSQGDTLAINQFTYEP